MVDVVINGCNGTMGRVVYKISSYFTEINVVCGIDFEDKKDIDIPVYSSILDIKEDFDVIIDFSHPFCLDSMLDGCLKLKKPVVIATTGFSDGQISRISDASKIIPIFSSFNMSLGVNLLCSLVKKASKVLSSDFDIEIIEKHHNKKVDNPSGTALMIADSVNNSNNNKYNYVFGRENIMRKREKSDIGIHAIRGGTYPGEHEVIFAGHDEIITISHTALSKDIFAKGALNAAVFLVEKPAGLYNMDDLI